MTTPASSGDGAFWDWSLRHYAREGVSKTLLDLQDKFGLNVNILLWCGWCACRFEEVPELVLRKAIDLTARWNNDVTGALRGARRAIKTPPRQADAEDCERLRENIKSAELAAEKIEQEMLAALAQDQLSPAEAGDAIARARRNIARYASLSGCARSPNFSTALLDALIELIFRPDPDAEPAPPKND